MRLLHGQDFFGMTNRSIALNPLLDSIIYDGNIGMYANMLLLS
jgi:hypothetical protein